MKLSSRQLNPPSGYVAGLSCGGWFAFAGCFLGAMVTTPVGAATTITYSYDDLDRLTGMARSDGPSLQYGYDGHPATEPTGVGNLTARIVSNSPDTDNDLVANFADPDDDNDGMPDAWELQFSFDTLDAADALLDTDSDGRDNLTEYQHGTDPLTHDLSPAVLASLMILINQLLLLDDETGTQGDAPPP